MEGTPASCSTAFPGWYVNFQAALLQQAPRPGEINQETADGWIHNQAALKKVLAEGLLPCVSVKNDKEEDKFKFIKTIDLVVPEGYDHDTWLAWFRKANYEKFTGYSDNITDDNFTKVTTKLVAGQKGKVKIFQIKKGVSSLDCLKKLKEEKAILVGAQGSSLVWELKKEELPFSKWSVSFDEKEALWQCGNDLHAVPRIFRYVNGTWEFHLGYFESAWDGFFCLLCFCDFQ